MIEKREKDIEKSMAAAVLAGGQSIRMGRREKGLISLKGMPLIVRTIQILKDIFDEIILITRNPGEYQCFDDIIVTCDLIKGCGPLGGIHAGLCRSSKDSVFIVACDMPFLQAGFIRRQAGSFKTSYCDALIPRIGQFIEPLHAIYRRELKDKISWLLSKSGDYAIRSLFTHIKVRYLDLDETSINKKMFVNLNTPKDFKNALKTSCKPVKS